MRNDKLSVQSMDFAVSVINLVKYLKENKEHIISCLLYTSDAADD